jgi:hypothetical protein
MPMDCGKLSPDAGQKSRAKKTDRMRRIATRWFFTFLFTKSFEYEKYAIFISRSPVL